MEIQKRCKYCGRSFIAHKMTTIYCSPSCNNKDYKRAIRQKQIAEYMEEEKQKTPKVDILGVMIMDSVTDKKKDQIKALIEKMKQEGKPIDWAIIVLC